MMMKKIILGLSMVAFSTIGIGMLALAQDTENAPPLLLQKQQAGQPLSSEEIERFGRAFEAVRELYVDNLSDQQIMDNAIQGMLSGLDPHSEYLNPEDLRDLKTQTDGEFTGVGIEIMPSDGVIRVVTPIDGSPAVKAGIKSGDYIIKVDGKSVRGMKLTDVMNEMRGPKGSQVKLTIVRKGADKPIVLTVTRDVIPLKSVAFKVMSKNYGYIRVSRFQTDTGTAVKDAIAQLKIKTHGQLKGVILDLRNNPGGLLDAAVDVSSAFLDLNKIGYDQNVVYTKGRVEDSNESFKANGKDLLSGVPMVVLINSGSASAAEIVAGALQDDHRALLVGTRSFGKGSVQTLLPLDADGSTAIKLTTARYYTPSGRSIQAQGIVPDVIVRELMVPKTAKYAPEYWESEASLEGHLANPGSEATPPLANPAGEDIKTQKADQALVSKVVKDQKKSAKRALIYRDYQLYEALNLLKALSVTNQMTVNS